MIYCTLNLTTSMFHVLCLFIYECVCIIYNQNMLIYHQLKIDMVISSLCSLFKELPLLPSPSSSHTHSSSHKQINICIMITSKLVLFVETVWTIMSKVFDWNNCINDWKPKHMGNFKYILHTFLVLSIF